MVLKNIRNKRLNGGDIEMAVRAVEGIPNAMDKDFGGVDPDPTSLDVAPEGREFVEGPVYSTDPVDGCVICSLLAEG